LSRLLFAQGATQAGCGVRLTVRGYRSAISIQASISSWTVPLLLMSGANYLVQRF